MKGSVSPQFRQGLRSAYLQTVRARKAKRGRYNRGVRSKAKEEKREEKQDQFQELSKVRVRPRQKPSPETFRCRRTRLVDSQGVKACDIVVSDTAGPHDKRRLPQNKTSQRRWQSQQDRERFKHEDDDEIGSYEKESLSLIHI